MFPRVIRMLFGIRALRTIATTVAVVTPLVACGQPAASPADANPLACGWWNAARRACRDTIDGGSEAAAAAATEQLALIDRWQDEAARAAADRHGWLRQSGDWQVRWSRPLRGDDPPEGRPVQPAWAGAVVAWEAGHAVHAVLATSGMPAWRGEAAPDTALFHPSLGPRRTPVRPGWLTGRGHALFAALPADDATALVVCLDCSTTAEGRLTWAATMPDGMAVCDGPVAVDDELCAVVCRTADDRGMLTLVVCDARDGRLLWQRPCGTAQADDGLDHGRGSRTPLLHEGLVVVADHAGGVTAFTRRGQAAWTYRYAPARPSPDERCDRAASSSLASGRDTLIVAPRDHDRVFALEDNGRGGAAPQVRWTIDTAARIVGTSPTQLVLEVDTGRRLETVSIADGGVVARSQPAAGLSGAILAGDIVIHAVATADGSALVPLGIATLQPVGPAYPLGHNAKTSIAIALGPAALAVATPGMLSCIEPKSTITRVAP